MGRGWFQSRLACGSTALLALCILLNGVCYLQVFLRHVLITQIQSCNARQPIFFATHRVQ